MEKLIVVISGPSGAGKGTIYKKISEKRNDVYRYVSYTTRKKRESEVEGFDYNYVSFEEFQEKKESDFFLETIFYDGNYYGTPIPKIEQHNDVDLFFDLNPEGGLKIKEKFPKAILIYIMPPNLEELKKRMENRGNKRLEFSKQEIELAKNFEWIVVNDDLESAVTQVENIIELCRKHKMYNKLNQDFLNNFY